MINSCEYNIQIRFTKYSPNVKLKISEMSIWIYPCISLPKVEFIGAFCKTAFVVIFTPLFLGTNQNWLNLNRTITSLAIHNALCEYWAEIIQYGIVLWCIYG